MSTHMQATQKGVVGIALNTGFSVPFSDSQADKDAASRAMDFSYGWYALVELSIWFGLYSSVHDISTNDCFQMCQWPYHALKCN